MRRSFYLVALALGCFFGTSSGESLGKYVPAKLDVKRDDTTTSSSAVVFPQLMLMTIP